MPAKSRAQYRFMQAAAHNPKFAKKAGISTGTAAEYVEGQKNYKRLPARKGKKR